ncbi:hemin transport system permease protein HmuU [Clostridium tepidiprofundi DSM 19306]|uniref:Hemin transport system permease protein HmuU n=1 Tax=Clostridium tepidiprofundi DSM 19306 TaxID=1121338 RepID=A0A151B6K9_9CLOT|nr:iron ABC transporter permease [Clostridium tepidiprofundi]KYH35524.1 hemin transport system permease protein HmuU [Clostridium tepidiprofundi DSM 19306]
MNRPHKITLVVILMILVLVLMFIAALACGKVNLLTIDKELGSTILFKVRLPRIILAIIVGMALSVSGVVLQCLLNNPLADSYTLGISSGAAFGACLAIYINITYDINIPTQPMAILFSLMVLIIVIWMAKSKGYLTTSSLVLAGIIVGSVCSAGVSFLKALADENATAMIFWLMGNLASKSMKQVLSLGIVILFGIAICMYYSKELNIMTMGRRESLLVGVNYDRIYKTLLVVCTVMTAFCVSLCGIIGFVGLVVPHLTRLMVGADNRKIIPISTLMGASLLLAADTITRSALAHELPVGVLTTLIGGPFFCYIFMTKRVE